jgi:hypothetical protein
MQPIQVLLNSLVSFYHTDLGGPIDSYVGNLLYMIIVILQKSIASQLLHQENKRLTELFIV